MHRHLFITHDGSHTIALNDGKVTYHSVHGAFQESMHVFIRSGLDFFCQLNNAKHVRIFEVGLGTGLNVLLTLDYALRNSLCVDYMAIEAFPLEVQEYSQLNYAANNQLLPLAVSRFLDIHRVAWGERSELIPHFYLTKLEASLVDFVFSHRYDLIYFDAFAPDDQPELWTKSIFEKIYNAVDPGGVLVTYCSKGVVRRTLVEVGFNVEKLPGPPGKREMIRCLKH